jgi:hypothetical protein
MVLTGKVEGLFGVDCGGTRSHAGGGMDKKAPEELFFGGRREASGAGLNENVL